MKRPNTSENVTDMKLDELNRKLLAAARAHAPSDRVPYAFEKRILARLASAPVPDALTLWAAALWRSAGAVAALAIVVFTCMQLAPGDTATPTTVAAVNAASNGSEELSVQFESTLLASVDQNLNGSEDAP